MGVHFENIALRIGQFFTGAGFENCGRCGAIRSVHFSAPTSDERLCPHPDLLRQPVRMASEVE